MKIDEVMVRIDGLAYRQVEALEQYAGDEAVFTVDQQNGRIHFGDGMHGRRPPAGSRVGIAYRGGNGAAGNVAEFPWPGDGRAISGRLAVLPSAGMIEIGARQADESSWRWRLASLLWRWIDDWLLG